MKIQTIYFVLRKKMNAKLLAIAHTTWQMITSFCFPADEPRPFPEEWYQHGYIENNDQPGSANHMYDEGSYATAPADDTWVPRWEDDRMGMMEHPHRGKQNYLL